MLAISSPVPITTSGWREALSELSVLHKNTTQCPRPGLEPGPLDPGTSALTRHEATEATAPLTNVKITQKIDHIYSMCTASIQPTEFTVA